ncbi:MAG TPA: alpha/beta fold hydrolase [Acidimicrobiales bacterium]|nr:alpha/beta fold hydrolase [Acidimicrobiales bacterium]
MALHVELRGAGPPLVVLHGFTQTGRLWGPFGAALETTHTLVAVDLPGHAGSDAVRADLPGTAALVTEAVQDAVGTKPVDLLGYSLGARVALHVVTGTALEVDRVVLIGAAGGLEDDAARARRRAADEAVAAELEASGDVDAFIAQWLRGPLFARLTALAGAGDGERRRNSAAGLASSLRLCGTGTQEPLWAHLPALDTPLLALAGADDTRFAAHALRLAGLAPHAVASLVPGGGHAVHLAQPEQTGRIVDHWLAAGNGADAPS